MIPVLTEHEFAVLTDVVVIVFGVLVGAVVFAFVVSKLREHRSDDLMRVVSATEEIGPAWERIPRSRP